MTDTSALDARHHARNIAERCAVAYWLGETSSEPGFHMAKIHSDFASLAAALGYRIESITEESEEDLK